MSQFRIILASGSPQRKLLLEKEGYEFKVIPPHESVESGICSNCGPAELVLDLSARKAGHIASQLLPELTEPALIVACDTVAECQGTILGKPRDEEHARAMLEQLRGTRHRVYSGLCLWLLSSQTKTAPRTKIAMTTLEMQSLTDAEIDDYLATGLWREKAGAFGLQDRPSWLSIVEGSESNVIGLPMELLAEMIAEM
ncbi:Maf family protein [Bythopirellula polymerisocia]|uniref:Nucleoside triphosphate pyrophosphatase n=1 Tax=Bythopirellula polymerisocia TaxID=2528003 RepID=A0A5C6CTR6_9BACT|nr:Maf family protein [Bythopirellula polymerisocia]TWU27265.1 Maf-like protein YhdE [Bythopirellula polymerisocia]